MLERIQTFFQSLNIARPSSEFSPDDPKIAIVALCLQVMEADGRVEASEKAKLRSVLKSHFDLDDGRINDLVKAARSVESEAVDYYRFTSSIKWALDEEQRIELIGILWDIAYADGERSELEDNAIWRIAELLGISGRDRIIMRQQAQARTIAPASEPESSSEG